MLRIRTTKVQKTICEIKLISVFNIGLCKSTLGLI